MSIRIDKTDYAYISAEQTQAQARRGRGAGEGGHFSAQTPEREEFDVLSGDDGEISGDDAGDARGVVNENVRDVGAMERKKKRGREGEEDGSDTGKDAVSDAGGAARKILKGRSKTVETPEGRTRSRGEEDYNDEINTDGVHVACGVLHTDRREGGHVHASEVCTLREETLHWLRDAGEALEKGKAKGLLPFDPSALLRRLWAVIPKL